jgi:tetratricopeptide (TPR) repeat protein
LAVCAWLGVSCSANPPAGIDPASRAVATPSPETHEDVEAISLLGRPLRRSVLFSSQPEKLLQDLEAAEADLRDRPDDPEAWIWLGRRMAYLGRYREAIDLFSRGTKRFPSDARFYRHRGHRYLTVRKVDLAIADFEKAVELVRGQPDFIEPDGAPNARNIPRSSLQSNIWYHLGLARFLKGDFAGAATAFRAARDVLANDDNWVASTHWLWMSLRRQGKTVEAAAALSGVLAEMDVIESQGYHRLLLLYVGAATPQELLAGAGGEEAGDAAVLFGVGNWYLVQGRKAEAEALFHRLAERRGWAPFGVLAAEAELGRLAQ